MGYIMVICGIVGIVITCLLAIGFVVHFKHSRTKLLEKINEEY